LCFGRRNDQGRKKRDEIFWNETLAPYEISRLLDPKFFNNAKRIDKNVNINLTDLELAKKEILKIT